MFHKSISNMRKYSACGRCSGSRQEVPCGFSSIPATGLMLEIATAHAELCHEGALNGDSLISGVFSTAIGLDLET